MDKVFSGESSNSSVQESAEKYWGSIKIFKEFEKINEPEAYELLYFGDIAYNKIKIINR